MNNVQSLWGLVGAENLVFGLFWLVVRRVLRPEERGGILTLALFNLCMGVGLILIALRQRLPDLITYAGADALVVLALAMMWHGGAAQFSGKHTREPLVVAGLVAAVLFVSQWHWPEHRSGRTAMVYLAISWIVARPPWLALPTGPSRFDHDVRVLVMLRLLAIIAALWLTTQAVGGLLWGWVLEVSIANTRSYVTAYGALIALTLVNSALYFLIVRSLVRELEHQVSRDAMTGLLNRRAFQDRLDRRWKAWQRRRRQFVLISIDVDHFKSVNDGFGHAAGDAVLLGVADVLQAHARPRDVVARVGGEEFVVILDAMSDASKAMATAERLRAAVEAMPVPPELGARRVTISAGVAMVDGMDVRSASTLARSDQALYRAKSDGRNRVCLAHPLA